MDMSSIVSTFNVWANSYDTDIKKADWGFECYSDAMVWICHHLMKYNNLHRVIDLGCGTGTLAERIQQFQPQIEYVGVDICPNMLNRSKKRLPTGSFIQADIRDHNKWIKYLDPSLNCAIVSTYALHHINDKEKIELFKYIFSKVEQSDFFFAVVDYAFLNASERVKMLNKQHSLLNYHITSEIESEHYANLSYLKTNLSQNDICCSFEKNGIWDWRYFIHRKK